MREKKKEEKREEQRQGEKKSEFESCSESSYVNSRLVPVFIKCIGGGFFVLWDCSNGLIV